MTMTDDLRLALVATTACLGPHRKVMSGLSDAQMRLAIVSGLEPEDPEVPWPWSLDDPKWLEMSADSMNEALLVCEELRVALVTAMSRIRILQRERSNKKEPGSLPKRIPQEKSCGN